MMTQAVRQPTLLERWLEDVPSATISNSPTSVKKERKDLFSSCPSSSSLIASPSSSCTSFPPQQTISSSSNMPSSSHPLISSSLSTATTSTSTSAITQTNVKQEESEKSKSIDEMSIKGVFGWQVAQDIPLPVILRDNEKLVAVRIVESKVIGRFSTSLPWTVFSCINIKSYYVTENESKLLNDINLNHCEYHYGYEPFSTKDVVVCFPDVLKLYEFLETSKNIFTLGLAKSGIEWLGFVNISGSFIVPFISKKSPTKDSSGVARKYVPQSLVQQTVLLVKVEKCDMTEWDASYLRMLCVYAGFENLKIQSNDSLCLLDDLKWDTSLCPLHIEDCVPPNSKLITNNDNSNEMSKAIAVKDMVSYQSTSGSQSSGGDSSWIISSPTNSSNALRSLHQIIRVDMFGVGFRAINLKPYSNQQAVFVSEVVTKMFQGVSILTAHYILEKILQVKLYECTRLQEDAFLRSGVRPLQGDKLVGIDVLKKCLPQLRQIIMAGMPLTAHTQ